MKRYFVLLYYIFLLFCNANRQIVEALSSKKLPRLVSKIASSSSSSLLFLLPYNGGSSSEKNTDNVDYDDVNVNVNDDFLRSILQTRKLDSSDKGGRPTITSTGESAKQRPDKSNLYGDNELANLLELHEKLNPTMTTDPDLASGKKNSQPIGNTNNNDINDNDLFVPDSIHDLIVQTVGEIEIESLAQKRTLKQQQQPHPLSLMTTPWISKIVREKIVKYDIKAVACDIDGTIIGSDHQIHPKTKHAILRAAQHQINPLPSSSNHTTNIDRTRLEWIFPATGKTRWGAMNSLGPELSFLGDGPGVFIQGLYCVVNGNEVIFEKKLNPSSVEAAEQLAFESDVSIVAYDGDNLYTINSTRIEAIELHTKYGEPLSQEIPTIKNHKPGVHKLLLLDNDLEKLSKLVRPKLERLALETGGSVTQAIPTMLELLPYGCSKALGVQKVCEFLNIDPSSQLLAMGDAENDVGMLEDAAIGVAVNNADEICKNAVDVVLPLTSKEGGVGLALEVILGV